MFNLYTIVKAIEKIGNAIPDVNTVVLSDIFKLNELPDIDYSVFAIIQDQHREDDEYVYMNFYLYYVDRLLNDHSNQLEIQSHGMSLLSTVIGKIEDLGIVLSPDTDRIFQPFNQKFSDECAGVYARVELMIPIDCTTPFDVLVNPLLADLATYQPGTYYPQDFGADAFRVVTVSGQSYHYYTEQGKTGKIDNGEHSLSVEQSGVYIDGKEVTTNDVLSGYTYNKETTNNLIQAALEGFDDVIAQVSSNTINISANTADISTISAMTSANTSDIQDILQRISGLTGDYVEKQPTHYIPSLNIDNPLDLDTLATSGYYVIEGISNTNTINKPNDDGSAAIIHAICFYKENEQGPFLDDAVQIYFAADDDTSDTRIYMRRHFWDNAQGVNIWGPWVLLSGSGGGGQIDTALSSSSTNPVENRVVTSAITYLEDEIDDLDNRYDILEALVFSLQGEIEDLKKQISGSTSGETSGSTSGSTSGETSGGCVTVLFRSNSSHTDCFEDGVIPYGQYRGDLAITGVSIGSGITRIADSAFWGCSGLTSVAIPSTVTEIGGAAFMGCSGLTSVTIPSSVTSIGAWAFRSCESLESINIPDSVTNLEAAAFGSCINATALTIGSGITAINTGVFEWCTSISSVTIPDSITSIGTMAFMGCSGLQTLTIGNRVTSIKDKGFSHCTSLSDITCYATDSPALVENPFDRLPSTGTLHVPTGSDYSMWLSKLGSGWSVQYI